MTPVSPFDGESGNTRPIRGHGKDTVVRGQQTDDELNSVIGGCRQRRPIYREDECKRTSKLSGGLLETVRIEPVAPPRVVFDPLSMGKSRTSAVVRI